jgi:thioredoxin 1
MSLIVEDVMRSSSDAINFAVVDTDHNPISATEYMVRSIPSILLFKNGRVVADIVGAVPKEVLINQIEKHINSL